MKTKLTIGFFFVISAVVVIGWATSHSKIALLEVEFDRTAREMNAIIPKDDEIRRIAQESHEKRVLAEAYHQIATCNLTEAKLEELASDGKTDQRLKEKMTELGCTIPEWMEIEVNLEFENWGPQLLEDMDNSLRDEPK